MTKYSQKAVPEPAEGAKRVLIVDDEPAVLQVVGRIMKAGGYASHGVMSGGVALERLAQEEWDLVITDRTMPGLNGEELARKIHERAPGLPVIMVTGFPQSVERPDLFDAVLGKPFHCDELLAQVERALARGAEAPRGRNALR